MIVDYLSSFYEMPCLVSIAGQVVQTTIRWYRAPVGAKPLPFPTTFFSHINDNNPGESIPGELGEVGFPRTWDAGRNPGYQGQCYRGDPAWFATGQLPTVSSIPTSACLCQIPPAVGNGGVVLGGTAVVIAANANCGFTPKGAPVRYKVQVAGGSGVFAAVNGVYTATQILPADPCQWGSPSPPQTIVFSAGSQTPIGNISLGVQAGAGHNANYVNTGPFDYFNPTQVWRETTGQPGVPTQVVMSALP